MNDFIESFFDSNDVDFKLWSKEGANLKISDDNVIYKGQMLKINRKNNKTKPRFFVLTKDFLYYLKSDTNSKVRGFMSTKWVRVQYIKE